MIKTKRYLGYFVFGVMAFLMLTLMYYYRFDTKNLLIVSALGSFAYAIWGIIQHVLERKLTKVSLVEYLLFASLIFLLLVTALYI